MRYVRVAGLIDSDAEFEDADHRPLVVRRTSLRWRRASGRGPWTTFESATQSVPFVVREGLDEIGVEGDELADGLIVVPRTSRGRVSDLGERVPDGVPAEAEATLAVEQGVQRGARDGDRGASPRGGRARGHRRLAAGVR